MPAVVAIQAELSRLRRNCKAGIAKMNPPSYNFMNRLCEDEYRCHVVTREHYARSILTRHSTLTSPMHRRLCVTLHILLVKASSSSSHLYSQSLGDKKRNEEQIRFQFGC
jgi:hypothetical protein